MKQTLLTSIAAMLLLLVATVSSVIAQSDEKSRAVVANLYEAAKTKNLADWSRSELKKYFTDELADAIYDAAQSEDGLNFDILYYDQDTKITNFYISGGYKVVVGNCGYKLFVSFKNFGKSRQLNYTLAKDLRIADIEYDNGTAESDSLLDILKK